MRLGHFLMLAQPSSVLFACTMNSIRSPMAEAICKHYCGHSFYVDSVGVQSGQEIDGFAVAVMEEIGIDLKRHHPKTFTDLADDSYDLIITLSPEAHHHALDLTRHMACEVEFWNTFDPTLIEGSREDRLNAYRQVRDFLIEKILERFPACKNPA